MHRKLRVYTHPVQVFVKTHKHLCLCLSAVSYIIIYVRMQTDSQTNRWTDEQTDRHADMQAGRQADRHTRSQPFVGLRHLTSHDDVHLARFLYASYQVSAQRIGRKNQLQQKIPQLCWHSWAAQELNWGGVPWIRQQWSGPPHSPTLSLIQLSPSPSPKILLCTRQVHQSTQCYSKRFFSSSWSWPLYFRHLSHSPGLTCPIPSPSLYFFDCLFQTPEGFVQTCPPSHCLLTCFLQPVLPLINLPAVHFSIFF